MQYPVSLPFFAVFSSQEWRKEGWLGQLIGKTPAMLDAYEGISIYYRNING